MCGIVFVANSCPHSVDASKAVSKGSSKLNNLFKDMMIASAVRGTDGTGLFQVDGGQRVYTAKKAVPSAYIGSITELDNIASDVSNSVITVGHVRAATQGKVSDDNSHPFQAWRDDGSYIIGVHNGSLYGWNVPKNQYDVDSEWALNLIATDGMKAFEEIYGAYTFVWWDSLHPTKLFFVRNEERPLHIARTSDKNTILGASEAGMLEWLANKHGVSIEEVFAVDKQQLMSIDITNNELSVVLEQEVEDAWYNYSKGGQRQYTTGTATTPTIGSACPMPQLVYDSSYSETNYEKDELVRSMKECLRQARWNLVGDEETYAVVDVDTPVELGPLDGIVPIKAQPSWYSAGDIDVSAVKRAMHEGVYGSVVQWEAVEYDSFTDSMVGEIVSPASLKNPIAYVRNLQPFEADKYDKKAKPMVVIGATNFGDELEYVVTDLTKEGREALMA